MSTVPSPVTVHCIGNAHIDPVWRWPWTEGYAETLATCRAALDRLRESDDFVFSRGQAATYAWIEENDPALFEEIAGYVRARRWQLINGWWEQPDANIPAGESYVRHALYGKRYFREKFGVDVTVGWNPDTFGHNAGLPQILAKSGYRTYVFFRPGRHEMELPAPFFWWQGPDGNRILAIRPPVGHYAVWEDDLSGLIRRAAEVSRTLGLDQAILCYGVGNHGGGPTKRHLESIRSMRDTEGIQAIFSSIEGFELSLGDSTNSFPTVTTDLQHHAPGCYTTHSEVKRLNRQAENRLQRAEGWCALATLTLSRPYPASEFAHAWKQVLFNQFHDILAGTSVPIAYEQTREQIHEAFAIASRLQNAALQALAAHIDTRLDAADPPAEGRGFPVLLFNPSSVERTEPVTAQWGWGSGRQQARLLDEQGADVPFQFTQPDLFDGGRRIYFEATVPAHGWRVYRLMTEQTTPESESGELTIGETWLESPRWRLEFDAETGFMARCYDKVNDVEALSGPACALRVMADPGDTWGHDIAAWREEVGRFSAARFKIVERGPARVTLRVESRWQNSTTRQEFTLHRLNPRIDVELTLDWHEQHKMLKLCVPVAVRDGELTYEAPYSTIVRHADGKEDPGQSWIDLSGTAVTRDGRMLEYGVSLLNDNKYGFDCLKNDLRMSLLRSPIYCFHDPAKVEEGKEYLYMDQGVQTVRYALLPHIGSWRDAETATQAHALNNPLEYLFQYPHLGEWGASGALLNVTPTHVTAATLKGAEESDGLILRLFEIHGRPAHEVVVTLPGGRILRTDMGPHELKTLCLTSKGAVEEVSLLET